jgi:hypothetical protein
MIFNKIIRVNPWLKHLNKMIEENMLLVTHPVRGETPAYRRQVSSSNCQQNNSKPRGDTLLFYSVHHDRNIGVME